MSNSHRLSDLAGITDYTVDYVSDADGNILDHESGGPLWPLNAVLLLLGAAILGIAFVFLDPREPRLQFNPWTYAVATPIVLLVLSMLLSSVVSRVVEKSMQMAFLLSVLIHLILMVCAVNVVVFSRMWPDLIDSLAEQREQLKRESVQAKQYFQLSNRQQTGRRPDYLKHVQTQHQPTEFDKPTAPNLELARSQKPNLASPSPKVELQQAAHLIERDQPVTSLPRFSETVASLSRSEVSYSTSDDFLGSARIEDVPFVPLSQQLDNQTLQSLQAATTADRRSRRSEARQTSQSAPQVPPQQLSSTASDSFSALAIESGLQRSEPTGPTDNIMAAQTAMPRTQQPPSKPPRSTLADRSQTQAITRQIEQPLVAETASSSSLSGRTGSLENATAASSNRRQDSSRSASATSLFDPQQLSNNSSVSKADIRSLAMSMPSLSRSVEQNAFEPAVGDIAEKLPRNIAGGQIGPAARLSMPVRGVPESGSEPQEKNSNLQSSSFAESKRRTDARRSQTELPMAGRTSGAEWSGALSLTTGMSGRSPTDLSDATQGMSAARDIAGLSGAAKLLERSATSALSNSESLRADRASLPSPTSSSAQMVTGPVIPEALVNQATASAELQPSDAVGLSGKSRQADRTNLPPSAPNSLAAPSQLAAANSFPKQQTSLTQPSVSDWQRAEGSEPTSSPASTSAASSSQQRDTARSQADGLARQAPAAPVSAQPIELPATDADQLAESAGDSDINGMPLSPGIRADSVARRGGDQTKDSVPLASLLELEQPLGPGGLKPDANFTGGLMARRDNSRSALNQPQFETQRFERADVGGLLAAGQKASVPKPAFQQRIERLKDREAQIESSLEPQTELAIERGLAFLADRQRSDGSWRLEDFDTEVLMRSDTAATGLALLAFQGAGYTHKEFKYAATVEKALQFLTKHQTGDGDLYIPMNPASDQNAWLYSHAIAALAMCEAYGMTQDPNLRPAAQKAVDFMVASQDPLRGGWRYRPGAGADTSVTGWFMMAFKSGQLAGLDVPAKSLQAIEAYLNASQASVASPHLYRYNPFASDTAQQRHGLQPTPVMTSVGLLMRLYFGWQRERTEMLAGTDHLLENLPENGTAYLSRRDTYYWYYATQVMFHMRGQRWKTWHDRLYPLLINSQETTGEFAGSWDPNYPTPDLWSRYGGRLYVTTMNLLSLEVSYRHLPLYEATAQ